jgi:glycosyltransferase involved in cell wall biosynthesis
VRVLWLTPELPNAPGGSGGSTRQFHLIRALRERGDDVTVLAPVAPDQQAAPALLEATGARLLSVERPASRPREAVGALRRDPRLLARAVRDPLLAWQVGVFWAALRPRLPEALAERPDVAVVEHDWAARWGAELPAELPRALGLENLSWGYYEARARAAGGARGALMGLEARRFAAFDRRALRGYDLLLAMSEDDRAAVRAVSDVRCELVPNGVDTSALTPAPEGQDPVLLFTGTLSYPPNAEALLWLLRDIWPRIRAAHPAVRLAVVGRGAPEEAARLADDRVELAGWVDSMAPWFARASVVIVPMRSGGGTRLKVLDGLASGRALLTTTMGAEGVDLRSGEHALVADGAEAFADAALALLADRERRARLGAAGRALAEDVYDWGAIGARLGQLLDGMASVRS